LLGYEKPFSNVKYNGVTGVLTSFHKPKVFAVIDGDKPGKIKHSLYNRLILHPLLDDLEYGKSYKHPEQKAFLYQMQQGMAIEAFARESLREANLLSRFPAFDNMDAKSIKANFTGSMNCLTTSSNAPMLKNVINAITQKPSGPASELKTAFQNAVKLMR
jgi:hypothetical protein